MGSKDVHKENLGAVVPLHASIVFFRDADTCGNAHADCAQWVVKMQLAEELRSFLSLLRDTEQPGHRVCLL